MRPEMMSVAYEELVTFDETGKVVRRCLEDVWYSTSKNDPVSVTESNDATRDFFKRLAELPVRKCFDHEAEV
jgi:hypothetical protein